jgi:hypothetical protein
MAWASLLSAQAPEATPQLREYAKEKGKRGQEIIYQQISVDVAVAVR